jgi:syntaxin-binding protein 1
MSKLSQHMHIAHECMDQFSGAGLMNLSDVELELATGKDENDRSAKLSETIRQCESVMLRIQDPKDRLRLMLIATISQGGLSRSDKDRLLRAAQLGRKELQTLESLSQLGISTTNNKASEGASSAKKGFLG